MIVEGMKMISTFNTITEKDVLYYAFHGLSAKIEKEENHLMQHPTSEIARARLEKYHQQRQEVNARIIEIEKAK